MSNEIRVPAEPDADERDALEAACLEGLVETAHGYRYRPALGADAVLRLGYSRTTDAHLAAAKAEALEELRERLVVAEQRLRERAPTFWESVERERVSGKAQGVQLALSYVDEAIRLREQGGER